MTTAVEGLLKFTKAEYKLEGDVLIVYLPKNFSMFKQRIKDNKKDLLDKFGARKLRIDTKKKDEVILDLNSIEVTVLSEVDDGLLKLVNDCEFMAIDFETDSKNPMTANIISVGLSFLPNYETFYIPIDHTGAINVPMEVVMEFLKYAESRIKFVVHNLSFEKKLLDRYNILPEYVDTMILTYLKGGLRNHGLKHVAKERLGVRMKTFEEVVGTGKNQKRFQDVDVDEAAQYCGSDALYTAKLLDLLYDDIDNDLITLDHNTALVCSNMEVTGVLIDKEVLSTLRSFCERRKHRLEKLIYATAGEKFNINSSQQLGKIIYDKLGITPDAKEGYTATGRYATGEKAIEALVRNGEDNRIIKHIAEYRNVVKLIGTYIDRILEGLDGNGRYHPYFKFTGADTGRLSSDFQQMPASGLGAMVRKSVIPPPGHIIVAADYSQIELRLLAHLMQDEKVNGMIRNGVDLHTATASIIFGIPVEQLDPKGPERARAKTMNFAIVYGRGDYNIANDLGISLQEAKKFKAKYFAGFPKLEALIAKCIEDTKIHGYSETMTGRRRYLKDINSRSPKLKARAERQAFNAIIQGSAADLVRQAMPVAEKLAKQYSAELILQVHDELVFYVPSEVVEEFSKDIIKVMEMDNICGVKIDVPIKVDIGTGKNYLEAK